MRLSAKNENSAFHPKNVDYHLIGSLQDLQTHFHLSQLHLPKETISVVTDTRYVFQPVTRLSKTKGKIEVMIQVGSQFVQVTTTKKQEIVPGLRLHATVNDIFRLTEVDEAPTSIQTEDDSAFGLRADSGKIVMYFTSPRKSDVLQAIRGAKIKYSKDLKPSQPFERLIRPQDIPGTLLNISFTNLASLDQNLRIAAYNLLCALCQTFKFGVNSSFMASKGRTASYLHIPYVLLADIPRIIHTAKCIPFHCQREQTTCRFRASTYSRFHERVFCWLGEFPLTTEAIEFGISITLVGGSEKPCSSS